MARVVRFFSVLLAAAAAVALSSCAVVSASSEVSDFLVKNGLPAGLLPSSISSYSLQPDGSFQVQLLSSCYAKFQNLVWYDKIISGRVSYGKVDNLSGIQAEEFFVWVSVTSIYVDVPSTGYIYFDVGFVTKKLSVALFNAPPACYAAATQLSEPAQKSHSLI